MTKPENRSLVYYLNNGCFNTRQPLSALEAIISCSRANHRLNPRQSLAQVETAIGSNKDSYCRQFSP